VIRDHLRDLVTTVPGDLVLGPVSNRIVTALGTQYRAAHDTVLTELNGQRYFNLLDALDRFLANPPLTDTARGKPDKVLLPMVAKTWRKLRRLDNQAAGARKKNDPHRHDALLHEVRKAAKRARYAGEALAPRYGKPAKSWAGRMEAIQEILGAHQDTVVIRDHIRQLAVAAHLDGENAFTYGILHTLEHNRAQDTETNYAKAWKQASRRSTHRWLRS
jgi:CHAD domain-containing protein